MSRNLLNPPNRLDKHLVTSIQQWSAQAERDRTLHQHQLNSIYDNKWFKMFVPENYGGSNLSLPEALHVEEALSYADGSTGWVVTLCAGAGWFVGFVDPKIASVMFKDKHMCIAGSGAQTGVAEQIENGYLINGSWRFASGSLHATAFTMNCLITNNGQQIFNPDGSPRVATFILNRNEVIVNETWKAMGMIATSSHSFEVNNIEVSRERNFIIDPNMAVLHDLIYQFPFLQFAETTLAVNISGMASRFIDLCELFLHAHPTSRFKQMVIETRKELNDSRMKFFDVVDTSWDLLVSKRTLSNDLLSGVSSVSHDLVIHSRESVNTLYPLCGLNAAFTDTEINRVWRNFHTAAQHSLFRNR